jgi:hypothetical protein
MCKATKIPEISFRDLLRGIVATNVLLGMTVAIFFCVIFVSAVVALGFFHPSIFKLLHIFFLLFSIVISYSLNVLFFGWWCFKGLFGSSRRRIVAAAALTGWLYLLLQYTGAATYADVAFPLVLLLISISDQIWERRLRT